MRSSSNSCVKQGQTCNTKDEKGERNCGCSQKRARLFVIGTGPGNAGHISKRAFDLLKEADAVAGYTTYIDLIKNEIKGKEIISTGMTREVERVEKSIDKALSGSTCALVSGGDPGIYAMAGLVFEMCQKREITLIRHNAEQIKNNENHANQTLEIEIVPGIPALSAGAALLGAPLTHDFAAISLSDLLTPWEKIEKRLAAAASADFVITIYNPKSKKRDWQLARAKKIIMEHRTGDTSVGVVTSAMRKKQKIVVTSLKDMDQAEVDMQTILFVGNSASVEYLGFMYTPRGYSEKYEI
ncbi:MAG: precorrin-3B C(17)-methyltransferase [Thermodesulfobacteriota bacterium]|nr:precorrin-3B C(17)-methyltransferase [Thermodesulfobacteriota bacterium]